MPRCVVKNCKYNKTANYVRDKGSVHLFRIPKNEERREIWRNALNLEKGDIFPTSNVCHLHFTEQSYDYEKSPFALHLKTDAVPVLDPLAENLEEEMDISFSPQPSTSTSTTEFLIPPSDRPSTSTGFYEEKQYVEIPSRSFTSLGFVEEKTPPATPSSKGSMVVTPRKRKLKMQLTEARKKIKRLRTSLRHFKKRVATLTDVLKSLRGKVSDETLETLNQIGPNEEFLQRQLHYKHKYGDQLKAFSLTLHYYSVKAYNFVRTTFNSALPHPKTISRWYKNVNGEAGFTTEVYDLLKIKCDSTNYKLICNLTIDEMAIRQHVEWDGTKYYGFVDFGLPAIETDCNPEAKQALVFMLVCINQAWKLPVGYFLIDGITGLQKKICYYSALLCFIKQEYSWFLLHLMELHTM